MGLCSTVDTIITFPSPAWTLVKSFVTQCHTVTAYIDSTPKFQPWGQLTSLTFGVWSAPKNVPSIDVLSCQI